MEKSKGEFIDIREGNISIVLDSYDAIFSDFDPRLYSERGLSDDFLIECKKAIKDKDDVYELRLLIPAHLRRMHDEEKIKKRLRDYFKKHLKEKEKEIKITRREGIFWFILGGILMLVSTYIYEYKIFYNFNKFLFNFLFIISQPAGWFFFWEGLGKVFIESKKVLPEYEFFRKMSESSIYFLNY